MEIVEMVERKAPKLGDPVAELPPDLKTADSRYWHNVVQVVKQKPGLWFPLRETHVSISRLRDIVAAKRGSVHKTVPIPLQDPAVEVAISNMIFYVRWAGAK